MQCVTYACQRHAHLGPMLVALADDPSSLNIRPSQAETDVKDWPFKTPALRGTHDPEEERGDSRATCGTVESVAKAVTSQDLPTNVLKRGSYQ